MSFDAVVVGGGPAGLATALALARHGGSVAVVDRAGNGTSRVGETLPPQVRVPLQLLGLWDGFLAQGHERSPGVVAVWGDGEPFANDFVANPYGGGWHVDRCRFDELLAAHAQAAGVELLADRTVSCVVRLPSGGWRVTANGTRPPIRLDAPFLVDATGRSSTLARELGARRTHHDRLVALMAWLPGRGEDGDRRLLLEATEAGWWYSSPLPGNRLIAAYLTDVDLVRSAGGPAVEVWRTRLRDAPHTEARVGPVASEADVRLVPASSSCRAPVGGMDWLAVGDAAAALDPLSGQGVIGALRGGLAAAAAVVAGSSATYAADVRLSFAAHLRLREDYYGRERRWPHSPFWRRRHPRTDRRTQP